MLATLVIGKIRLSVMAKLNRTLSERSVFIYNGLTDPVSEVVNLMASNKLPMLSPGDKCVITLE